MPAAYLRSLSALSATPSGAAGGGFGGASASIAGAGMAAATGLFGSIAAAYSQQAQGYIQQAGYAAQANANLQLSGLRADKQIEYANLSFDRRQFQTRIDQLNYKVQANSLLDNLRRTNASVRARAGAAGLNPGGGSAAAIQRENVRQTYQDVGMVELSALVARVFGMEDATNILRAGYDNAFYTRQEALMGADQALQAGGYARQAGSLMAGATLGSGIASFARTVPTDF